MRILIKFAMSNIRLNRRLFEILCSNILRGVKVSKKLTTEEFIRKAKIVHGNIYNYSEVEYKKGEIKSL
jgi:hypothetical protein